MFVLKRFKPSNASDLAFIRWEKNLEGKEKEHHVLKEKNHVLKYPCQHLLHPEHVSLRLCC
jgi:hypothetical protein